MAGLYFEEFAEGQVFEHAMTRTVTETDNILFTTMTMNPQPLHLDFHAAGKAEFGKPLVNSLLTLGIAVGLSVGETTLGTTVGNLGFENVEFPKPVFHGDTLYADNDLDFQAFDVSDPAAVTPLGVIVSPSNIALTLQNTAELVVGGGYAYAIVAPLSGTRSATRIFSTTVRSGKMSRPSGT